jgi:hypothetical protein
MLNAAMATLADDCAAINAAARPLAGELQVPALRVEPKTGGGDRVLYVGSANGVFTTYVGGPAEHVFVQDVEEWVPSADPCTGGPKPVLVRGVRLVDEKGRELMLQVRP